MISIIIGRNLIHRPLRSTLTVLGIALACTMYILLLFFMRGFEDSFQQLSSHQQIDFFVMQKNKLVPLTSTLDESVLKSIRSQPGVKAAAGVLVDLLTINEKINLITLGWEEDAFMRQTLHLLAGGLPNRPNEIMLGMQIAQTLGVSVGAELEIEFMPLKVVGIFEAGSAFEVNAVIMPIETLRNIRALGRVFSNINVQADQNLDKEIVYKSLQDHLAANHPKVTISRGIDFFRNSQIFKAVLQLRWALTFLAFLMILLSTMNTLGVAVLERTAEIGVLHAIGWSRARIVGLVMGESLAISLLGSGLGMLVSMFMARLLSVFPDVSFIVMGGPSPFLMLEAALLAIVGGIVGGFSPAIRALHLDPAEAFRYA